MYHVGVSLEHTGQGTRDKSRSTEMCQLATEQKKVSYLCIDNRLPKIDLLSDMRFYLKLIGENYKASRGMSKSAIE